MSTLSQHFDDLRSQFGDALADKRVSFAETLQITGAIVGAAACTLDKLTDNSRVGELISEAEALYDELLDPAKIDIPRVPEWAEAYVLGIGRQMVRPAIERLVDAIEGVR
jgi:hypothetical protein